MRTIRRAGVLLLLAVSVTFSGATLYTILETRRVQRVRRPAGQFISLDGARLHYVERGTGRPVLLLHGNPGFVQDWSAVLSEMPPQYRVLAFDRPGHGFSSRSSGRNVTPETQAGLVHAALERLHVECPILVGHSWGAALSLIYALQYPSDTCGLVLIAPRAFPVERRRSPLYGLVRAPVIGDMFRHSVMLPVGRRMIAEGLAAAYDSDVPLPDHLTAASELWSRPGQAEATVWDSHNLQKSLRSFSLRYGDVEGPVLILVGDHDRLDRESIPLSHRIRVAELVVVPRAGHQIPHVRPRAVVAAINSVAATSRAASVRER